MKLLLRVFFGLDVSFGILWYALVSAYLGECFNPMVLGFSVFCAISPDVDFLPWKIFRRKFNIQSHQDVFHHPTLLVPLGVGIGIIVARLTGIKELFISVIAAGSLVFHLYHDGTSGVGMHWLSPFSWVRIIMYKWIIPRKVDKKIVDDFYHQQNELEKGTSTFVEALTKRSAKTESITIWKIIFWVFCICFLVLYLCVKD